MTENDRFYIWIYFLGALSDIKHVCMLWHKYEYDERVACLCLARVAYVLERVSI